MEQLKINTGLESFIMPDKISQITENTIEAVKSFNAENLVLSLKIETLAQVCALHTRYATEFIRHAFLLKINSYTEKSIENVYGDYKLTGELTGAGKSAFSYSITAAQNNNELFKADLIIAVTDYSDTFKQQQLSTHYRSIFSCLTKNIQKD